MRLMSKRVVRQHTAQGAPLCAGVLYVDETRPVLLRRIGWETADDIHDGYSDELSCDNGLTWGTPVPRTEWSKTIVDGGFVMHTENALLYAVDRETLWHFTNRRFHAHLDFHESSSVSQICITGGTPDEIFSGAGKLHYCGDFGHPTGIALSFCAPIQDAGKRILVPVYWPRELKDEKPPASRIVYDAGLLIGDKNEENEIAWRTSDAVPFDVERTTRGLCEGTIAQLSDGKLAMILRGSNAGRSDLPGYKWITFSHDGGETWCNAAPLSCDDGTLPESSATGSKLFRSTTDGNLYWIGNLCLNSERASGNWPRSPLAIAQIQEEPFCIRRHTITIIGGIEPDEPAQVQHSNFKSYQDRITGEVVVYLTRYGERGTDNRDWLQADLYEYRVSLS
jgi:hypothetical protein